jgi:hypothetical protein
MRSIVLNFIFYVLIDNFYFAHQLDCFENVCCAPMSLIGGWYWRPFFLQFFAFSFSLQCLSQLQCILIYSNSIVLNSLLVSSFQMVKFRSPSQIIIYLCTFLSRSLLFLENYVLPNIFDLYRIVWLYYCVDTMSN